MGYLGRGLKGGKRGGNRTGTSAAIFSLEAADVGVAYSGEGRDESRGEEIGALGVGLRCGTDIEPPTALCCWLTWLEVGSCHAGIDAGLKTHPIVRIGAPGWRVR